MALKFNTVQAGWREAHRKGIIPEDFTLEQYAQLGNQLTKTDLFDAGEVGFLGKAGVFASRLVRGATEAFHLDDAGAAVGGFVGDTLFDDQELGQQVGKEAAVSVLNMAPALAGYALAGPTGGASVVIGNAATGALTAGDIKAQTGETDRALAGGTIAAFTAPTIGALTRAGSNVAGRVGSRVLGDKAAAVGNVLNNNFLAGTAARSLPAIGAGFGLDVGADFTDIGLAGDRSFAELGTADYWKTRVIANSAFLPLDIQQAGIQQKNVMRNLDLRNQVKQQEAVRSAENDTILLPDDGEVLLPNDPITLADVEVMGKSEPPTTSPLSVVGERVVGSARTSKPGNSEVDLLPYTPEQYRSQLDEVNDVRTLDNKGPLGDVEVSLRVQDLMRLGHSEEVAVQMALQQLRNEHIEARLEELKGDTGFEFNSLLDEVVALRPDLESTVKAFKKVQGIDEQFRDDVGGLVAKALTEDLPASEVRKGFQAIQKNRKARANAAGKDPTKKGRKSKFERGEVDPGTVQEQVKARGLETEFNKAFVDFSEQVSYVDSASQVDYVAAFYNVVDTWLKGGKGIEHLRSLLKQRRSKIESDLFRDRQRRGIEDVDENLLREDQAAYKEWSDDNLGSDWDALDLNTRAENILKRQGHNPNKAKVLSPFVVDLLNLFEKLTGKTIKVSELVDSTGRWAGLSFQSKTSAHIALNAGLKGKVRDFAALHEIFGHQYQRAYEAGQLRPGDVVAYEKFMSFMKGMNEQEMANLLNSTAKSFLPKSVRDSLGDTFNRTAGSLDESVANLVSILAYSQTSKGRWQERLKFMPQPVIDFFISVMDFARDVLNGVRGMGALKALTTKEQSMLKAAKEFNEHLEVGFKEFRQNELVAQRQMTKLQAILPGVQSKFLSDQVIDGKDITSGPEGVSVGIVADALMLPGSEKIKQFASKIADFADGIFHRIERYPAVAEWAGRALREESEQSHAHQRKVSELLFADLPSILTGKPKISEDGGSVGKIVNDPNLSHRFDDIIREIQVLDAPLNSIKANDPAEYARLTQGLDAEQISTIHDAVSRFEKVNEYLNSQKTRSMHEVGKEDLAMVMRSSFDGSNTKLREAAAELYQLYAQGRASGDFAPFRTHAATLKQDPTALEQFLKPVQDEIALRQQVYSKLHWVTERRFGKFQVSYNDGTGAGNGRQGFDTADQAREFVDNARKSGWKVFYPGQGFKEIGKGQRTEFSNFDDILQASEGRTIGAAVAALEKAGTIDAKTRAELDASRKGLFAAVNAENLIAELGALNPTRAFKQGRESLNMVEQHMMYAQKQALAIARQVTDAVIRLENYNPEILGDAKQTHVLGKVKKSVKNFRVPDPELGKAILKGNFAHYLLFNVSTGMIEATSWPLWLSPHLTEKGAAIHDSYLLPIKAANSIAAKGFNGAYDSGVKVNLNGRLVDAHEAIIKRAKDGHRIGLGQQQEVRERGWQVMEDFSRISEGKKPLGRRVLTKPLGAMIDMGSKFYGMFTGLNERIAFISLFELYRKQELQGSNNLNAKQFSDAYEFASRNAQVVNSSIGRAGRATDMFDQDNPNAWRSAAMAVDSLGSFNRAAMSNFYRRFIKGFKGDQSLSKKERAQQKKALIQSYATLAAMSGIIGAVPFGGSLVGLLNDQTDIEPERRIREFAAELGQDEPSSFQADLATHGLAYAAGAPYDLSGRYALQGMLGFNQYEGWSAKGFFGPTAGRVEDYASAVGNVFRGDLPKALEEALPIGLRNLLLATRDKGEVRDSSGKAILQPTQVERLGKAVGFQPSRVAKMQEVQRLVRTNQAAQAKTMSQLIRRAADEYESHGPQAAETILNNHAQNDPTFSKDAARQQLIQFLVRKKHGLDISSIGSRHGAQPSIMKTFDVSGLPNLTAVQRQRNVMGLNFQLGNYGYDPFSSIVQASLVDHLQNRTGLNDSTSRFLAAQFLAPDPNQLGTVQAFLQ